jgi:hypothetical protein
VNAEERIAATLRQEELIADLAASITFAAAQVGEFLRPHVADPTVEGRGRRWFQAQSEALHFLLHLARRAAPREPGSAHRRRLDEEISRVSFQSFVEVLLPELTPPERAGMRADFLRDVPDREARYAPCSRKVAREDAVFDTRHVFSLATERIIRAAGRNAADVPAPEEHDLFVQLHARLVELAAEADLDRKVPAASEALAS